MNHLIILNFIRGSLLKKLFITKNNGLTSRSLYFNLVTERGSSLHLVCIWSVSCRWGDTWVLPGVVACPWPDIVWHVVVLCCGGGILRIPKPCIVYFYVCRSRKEFQRRPLWNLTEVNLIESKRGINITNYYLVMNSHEKKKKEIVTRKRPKYRM